MATGQQQGGGFQGPIPVTSLDGAFPGLFSQLLDIQGSSIAYTDMNLQISEVDTLGTPAIGRFIDSQNADGTLSNPNSDVIDLVVTTGTPFVASSIGKVVRIAGSGGNNNGIYLIDEVLANNSVRMRKASGPNPAAEAGLDWIYAEPYSLLTDMNNQRTWRKCVNGTPGGDHRTALPTYERPTAVGTPVDGTLYNYAGGSLGHGVTLDAKAIMCPTLFDDIKMSNESALGDGASTTASGTSQLTVAGTPFTADHVGRILALSGTSGTVDDGDWKIISVDASNLVTLRRLTSASTLATNDAGSVTWTMYSNMRTLDTGIKIADAVDRTGFPVEDGADAGAYGPSNAILLDMDGASPTGGELKGFVDASDNPVWGRLYSGLSGTDIVVRFFTGANDGTATPHVWETDDPANMRVQAKQRVRMDLLDEDCLTQVFIGGTLSDAELVNDLNEIREALGLVDGDTLFDNITTTGDYVFNGVTLVAETMFEAINQQFGDNDYNIHIETWYNEQGYGPAINADGTDHTTILNIIAQALADAEVERFHYRHNGATIDAGTTLPIATYFPLAPTTYTLGDGAFAWMFLRGDLQSHGATPSQGHYREVAGGGAGKGNAWILYSSIRNKDDFELFHVK